MKKRYNPYEIDMQTLGYYVDRLLYAMIKRQNQLLRECKSDLQHSEFIVLKMLSALQGASQSQLADVMGKERSGISRTISSLVNKGYVERKSLNGSTYCLTLTEKGTQIKPLLQKISDKLADETLKGFSDKARSKILKDLHTLYQNIQSED